MNNATGQSVKDYGKLLALDFFSLLLANALYYYIRVRSGLFRVMAVPDFWGPVFLLTLFDRIVQIY